MDLKNSATDNVAPEGCVDHRVAIQLELPFITEEGLVLINRRSKQIQPLPEPQAPLDDNADIPLFATHVTPR